MELGFIILRHVNSELANNYWIRCYNSIRTYYPQNKILIIDDNSNYDFITNIDLYNTTIIQSEYEGRAELLPYIYYLKNKLFDTAVIIHDSVFLNCNIDLNIKEDFKILWNFDSCCWDQIEDITNIIKSLNNNEDLLKFYENKNMWSGCFGGMSIIKYDYLKKINDKYNLDILIDKIKNRYNRMSFERIIACLLQFERQDGYNDFVLLGDILKYCSWGIKYHELYYVNHLPIIKIWSGR
jgi:hypothetical protein